MDTYERLLRIAQACPALVFNNDGYERLNLEIVESHKASIAEIEKILRACVWGFVSFQNFKPRKDGSLDIRCQVFYNEDRSFVGVSYIPLAGFKES